ncbi:YbaB/EbfC family nucleoid-associated protein [Pelotomaculum propionicicum]|uniref:Nucleoid-associated protein n=1 Tax=Pelotomaculum propionicicum TaxID=258475 RepID=A0A4Y7RVE9_9FIRM|nr:YbaB/EbfC family nucleoid-associated protein [Pelotomaculum propionicicum]NLI11833.1 YbaB/EbfC family nucleoid-associated protein [Peptococcaceae bacterium]TEB12237.1 Nucleoid-associated protein [Pelotomaculum propionicicum]
MNMGPILAEIQRLQQGLQSMTIETSEGEGAVKIVMNGSQEVLNVSFDPAALSPDNIAALQIMTASAFNKAITASKDMIKTEVVKITGGLNLPNIPGLL